MSRSAATGEWAGRKTLLTVGKSYRVSRNTRNPLGPDSIAGERVRLLDVGYLTYDSSYTFTFEDDASVRKSYWLNDADPSNLVTEIFQG
jgi:hypothetical protein